MPPKKGVRKILLTGGAGFIGSHVADVYIQAGFDVVIVDNLSTGSLKNIPSKAEFYQVDVCDLEKLEKIFKEESPNLVNHHAAQIDVRTSVLNPQADATINIIGGIHLLELSRKYGASKFIYAGTGGALYGEVKNKNPKENSDIKPLSPYGVSKYCLEHYIQLYSRLHGLNYTILRYANVYGPRQNPLGEAGVVAILVNAMSSNKAPIIYGNGEQLRDYVFAPDVADANLAALESGNGEVINIGTAKPTSVNQLFELIKKETGFTGKPKYEPARAGEIHKSCLDVDRAKEKLGWSAKTSLQEGIRKTIQWQSSRRWDT